MTGKGIRGGHLYFIRSKFIKGEFLMSVRRATVKAVRGNVVIAIPYGAGKWTAGIDADEMELTPDEITEFRKASRAEIEQHVAATANQQRLDAAAEGQEVAAVGVCDLIAIGGNAEIRLHPVFRGRKVMALKGE